MTKKTFPSPLKIVSMMLVFYCYTFPASAQFLRTSFLINDAHYRMQLNPALTPEQGYVDIPVIGNFNLAISSNTLGNQDILDIFSNNKAGSNLTSDALYDHMKNSNWINLALNTEFISFGWWKGENFWSFNTGLRLDMGAQIPKKMFSLLRDFQDTDNIDWTNFKMDIGGESFNINAYTELGLGYARQINEDLTVGGKVKLLLGIGNLNMQINDVFIETKNLDGDLTDLETWQKGGYGKVKVDAIFESSFAGMKTVMDTKTGAMTGYEFDNYGIAGYGGAIDLGVAYRFTDDMTISAALNDIGFINWSKESNTFLSVDTEREYNVNNYDDFTDIVDNGDLFNYNLFGFQHEEKSNSRTTSLYSTFTAGFEYELLDDKVTFGALSTTRMLEPKSQTELTFSAAYRLKRILSLAASYSVIQSAGKSVGLALKLGPLFVGTDYMYFGKSTNVFNAFLGISVPLAGKRKNT
ncbi:MAG: DUF5723 family protein [Dysgonamonadaceae bacterium]|nr:DUF5723 family protein [Dysgonamonadaceae bacterium]